MSIILKKLSLAAVCSVLAVSPLFLSGCKEKSASDQAMDAMEEAQQDAEQAAEDMEDAAKDMKK